MGHVAMMPVPISDIENVAQKRISRLPTLSASEDRYRW